MQNIETVGKREQTGLFLHWYKTYPDGIVGLPGGRNPRRSGDSVLYSTKSRPFSIQPVPL